MDSTEKEQWPGEVATHCRRAECQNIIIRRENWLAGEKISWNRGKWADLDVKDSISADTWAGIGQCCNAELQVEWSLTGNRRSCCWSGSVCVFVQRFYFHSYKSDFKGWRILFTPLKSLEVVWRIEGSHWIFGWLVGLCLQSFVKETTFTVLSFICICSQHTSYVATSVTDLDLNWLLRGKNVILFLKEQ